MKHTPGPWKFDDSNWQSKVIMSDGATIFIYDDVTMDHHEIDETRANAKLIAESPNLLDRLDALVEQASWAYTVLKYEHDCGDLLDEIDNARKAIQNATE